MKTDRGQVISIECSEAGLIKLLVLYPDGKKKWSQAFDPRAVRRIDWSEEANLPTAAEWQRNPAFLVIGNDGVSAAHCPQHEPEC